VYDKKNETDKAIADFGKLIEVGSTDEMKSDGYNDRGWEYFLKGDNDRAISDTTQAISLNGKNVAAYSSRAKAYLKKGDIGSALADYGSIVRLTADDKNFSDALVAQNFAGIATPGVPLCAGAAVYMEMQVNKFLGKGDPAKYAAMLRFIESKGRVSQGQIVKFYNSNITTYIDTVVKKHNSAQIPPDWITRIKQYITDFFLTLNQSNFDRLKNEYEACNLRYILSVKYQIYEIDVRFQGSDNPDTKKTFNLIIGYSNQLKQLTGSDYTPNDWNRDCHRSEGHMSNYQFIWIETIPGCYSNILTTLSPNLNKAASEGYSPAYDFK
jgi:tetratricopeptide (TPR) repeat protein